MYLQCPLNPSETWNLPCENRGTRRGRVGGRTCEGDQIRLLGFDHPPEEQRRVDIGAAGGLRGQDVLASGHQPVAVMHIGHLQETRAGNPILMVKKPNPWSRTTKLNLPGGS